MAQPARPAGGHPLVDLVCVVVLGALLWLGAQAIGSITRASSLHPSPAEQSSPSPGH